MKKILSILVSLSMLMSSMTIISTYAEETEQETTVGENGVMKEYGDTAPKAIPANLITSGDAIDGRSSSYIDREHPENLYEQYTVNTVNPSNDVYTFHGSGIQAKVNKSDSDVELDAFEAGKTYVYQALVKNMNTDYTPYYGIVHPNNKGGNSNNIGSNTYGKTGMAVTSTEWMLFRDTITYPESYDSTLTGWKGQVIYQGARVSDTEVGASVAVKRSAVDTSVEGSMETGGLYLAEEVPYDIEISADKEKLGKYGSISFNAEVVNQIGIQGTLDQTVEWAVVSQDRTEVIEDFILITSGNTVTISNNGNAKAGVYAIVAVSDEYEMVKGLDFEVVDEVDYNDTTPKAIPANLITSGDAIDGRSSSYIDREHPENLYEQYTVNTVNPSNNVYTFHGSGIQAKANKSDSDVELEAFEAGKTYVYQALVKNMNTDYTPYYGIVHPNNKGMHSNNIGSNTYGKTGMAVTSTEWMLFRDTITYPESYDSTLTGWKGQVIYQGARVSDTEVGASVAVKRSAVDTSVEGSMETGGLYLAEEVAHDIKISTDKEKLGKYGSISFNAEVVNQIGIPGTLDQTVEWAVVSQDRTEVIEDFILTTSGNTVTVSNNGNAKAGVYTIVAVSEEYEMVKGLDFEVIDEIDYDDTAPKAIPANLITSGGAIDGQSSSYIDRAHPENLYEQYTVNTVNPSNNVYTFHGSGIQAKANKSDSGVELETFEAGKTYVYQALVKNMNTDYTPYYGIVHPNNKGGNSNNIGSNTYGKTGMAVTSTEWMLFRDTITYPESYDSTLTGWKGQVIYQGARVSDTEVGASVAVKRSAVDTSVEGSMETGGLYLAEEVAHDIKIFAEKEEFEKSDSISFNAEVVNQIGIQGTLDQTVEWAVVSQDRTEVIEDFILTTSGNTVTVSNNGNAKAGVYTIVAVSAEYAMVKGIDFTVTEKKFAQATLTLSQDVGYTWIADVSVSDAECEKVMVAIAAYSKDTNGNLTLLNVTTQTVQVTDGIASIDELWLGGDDYISVPSGTIVKAFVWENGTMKPITITENSISNIIIE